MISQIREGKTCENMQLFVSWFTVTILSSHDKVQMFSGTRHGVLNMTRHGSHGTGLAEVLTFAKHHTTLHDVMVTNEQPSNWTRLKNSEKGLSEIILDGLNRH